MTKPFYFFGSYLNLAHEDAEHVMTESVTTMMRNKVRELMIEKEYRDQELNDFKVQLDNVLEEERRHVEEASKMRDEIARLK